MWSIYHCGCDVLFVVITSDISDFRSLQVTLFPFSWAVYLNLEINTIWSKIAINFDEPKKAVCCESFKNSIFSSRPQLDHF